MESLDSFGEWLRERRTVLRLTQVELADCVGCSVSALRKIEADERRPSRQLAELLAGCLLISPEKQRLFVDAARGYRRVSLLGMPEPDTKAETPLPSTPPKTKDTRPAGPGWNLPATSTSLVGRETELASLAHLLGDPECRLLTLVGPGGIGKTRLAIEVACDVWGRFADGVFLASLAATSDSEFMVPAIAQAIGLNFAGPTEPRRQLVNYLRNKQILILLDNLEHLLDGVGLVVEMLERAPDVKLLATSRERLELRGEWVFEVQGLPVPAEDEAEELEKYSSIRLFLQRAQQAQVDFELSVEDRRHVVRICRLAEGMPLAIELAAAWVPMLSCAEIADEIERGLDILSTQLRDVPDRQRSLQAVFDHSWKLLAEEEKRVLRQLSVFRGGFQREAAQAVADASLPMLSALVAKSFLRRTAVGRYSLHELVRQYVATQLAEEPEEEVTAQGRHSAYFIELVSQLEGELKGPGQPQALAKLDAEIENFRAGWRWAVPRAELATVLKPLRTLWYFYDLHAWYGEAEATFGWAAIELDKACGQGCEPESFAVTLREYLCALQGWFYLRRGKLQKAELLLQSSLAALRSFATSIELADVLYYAGTVAWLNGDYPRARANYLAELAVAEQFGSQWDIGLATGNIGLVALTVGEYEEAQQRWQTALAVNRRLGDQRMVAAALHFSGILKRTLGAHDEAQACFRESLALSGPLGERWIYGMALSQLGLVTQLLGDHAEAIRLLKESVTLHRELGEHWSMFQALNGLGAATLAIGAYAESRAAYSEALTMACERQALPEVLEALTGLSRWWLRQGSPEVALVPTIFVLNHPAATEPTRGAAHQLLAELEPQLESAQVVTAQTSAGNLSLENLVASVLEPVSV